MKKLSFINTKNRGKLDAIFIENMGEAVKSLPYGFRRKYPNIPWKKIAGTRDVLAHDYFGIDTEKD